MLLLVISILNEVGLFYAPSESEFFEPPDSIVVDVRVLTVLLFPVLSPLGLDPSAELRVVGILSRKVAVPVLALEQLELNTEMPMDD